jgi:hypothetical protein
MKLNRIINIKIYNLSRITFNVRPNQCHDSNPPFVLLNAYDLSGLGSPVEG